MIVDDLAEKLSGIQNWSDWNDWVALVKESGFTINDDVNNSLNRMAKEIVNNLTKESCPQEYKDNPHIHYEVAKKKK